MSEKEVIAPVAEAESSIKNFRTAPDIENFYRFVHENNLRREAMMALSSLVSRMKGIKKKKNRFNKKNQQ